MEDSKPTDSDSAHNSDDIRETLHGETAIIAWADLQRLFAAGKVIAVDSGLDLIKVAAAMQADNKKLFEGWISEKRVSPVSDEQARFWVAADSSVWAVVVSPWVLVQEPTQSAQ